MSRPGFSLVVEPRTPSLLTVAGADVKLQRFPLGTRVLYPAEALPSSDPTQLVDQALICPVGAEPLEQRLRPGMKLTIVVGNVDPVLPRMRFDVRRSIVERVLEVAARCRVDDVAILVAGGLGARWRPQDVAAYLGDRVASSFLPDQMITSHDITAEDLVSVAAVDDHPIRLPARLAEADLVVVIDVAHGPEPRCPLAAGATDVATINRIQGIDGSLADCQEVAAAIQAAVPVFAISAVLGQPYLRRPLDFMSRREWEWRLPEQLSYAGTRQWVSTLPWRGARQLHASPRADYQLLDVIGGEPAHVLAQARQSWQAANSVPTQPSSVAMTSVWGSLFDEGDPAGSPISAARHALVTCTGGETGQSLVTPGGVVIAFHPLTAALSSRSNAPSADFLASVLPVTRDSREIADKFEPQALADEWYHKLYRDHNSAHPLAVFHNWYTVAKASADLAAVIWVSAQRETARLLGHRAASTLQDALELAYEVLGHEAEPLYVHGPGAVIGVQP